MRKLNALQKNYWFDILKQVSRVNIHPNKFFVENSLMLLQSLCNTDYCAKVKINFLLTEHEGLLKYFCINA